MSKPVVVTRALARRSAVISSGSGKTGPLNTLTLFQSEEDDSPETGEYMKALRSYESKALVDPFLNIYQEGAGGLSLLAPDYNPMSIIKLPNESAVLRECIDAMVTNIDAFGYRLEYIGEKDQEDSKASKAEKDRLESLLNEPNGEMTFQEMRERLRRDKETFGYSFTEVGRGLNGEVVMLAHVPAHTLRMTAKQRELVPVTQYLTRDGSLLKITTHQRFRLFAQQIGGRLVYFKEFGDPRTINPQSGREDPSLSFDQGATEIFHDTLYSPGSPYGMPRWISNLPSIMGIRESELTNLQFFKDNAIPAMAILVSGGALSADSVANVQTHFAGGRGRASMNRVVVLEATGDDDAAKMEGSIPPPRLDMKPLTSERQTDGHFAEYEDSCEKKVRGSFRLPPLFVGRSDDYSHATADASMVIADAQVFGPERNKTDDIYNSKFLVKDGMPLQYWRMRSNPPRLVSAEAILDALDVLDNVGAITPNIAIGIANELFDLAINPVEQEWGNVPFPIVMQLALAGNLDGIQDIMIVPDLIEKAEGRADDANKRAGDDSKAKNKAMASKVGDKNDDGKNGDGKTPSKKSVDLSRARKALGFQFRQIAMRGNDFGVATMAYKHARKRKRPQANTDKAA